ncbi:MAG: DUF3830 family protein [Streptosporangiaceae bacterium]
MKRFALTLSGIRAEGTLLEEAAPRCSETWWSLLPFEKELRHFRWGGDAGYTSIPPMGLASSSENLVTFYPRYSICVRPGDFGEIVFPYGQAQARSHTILAAWACCFAEIDINKAEFFAEVARTKVDGMKLLRAERIGGDGERG